MWGRSTGRNMVPASSQEQTMALSERTWRRRNVTTAASNNDATLTIAGGREWNTGSSPSAGTVLADWYKQGNRASNYDNAWRHAGRGITLLWGLLQVVAMWKANFQRCIEIVHQEAINWGEMHFTTSTLRAKDEGACHTTPVCFLS